MVATLPPYLYYQVFCKAWYLVHCGLMEKQDLDTDTDMDTDMDTDTDICGCTRVGLDSWTFPCYLFECRAEAKRVYYLLLSLCQASFFRVGRGQRSRAYLRSCSEKIRRALILNSQPWLKHIETELCHQLRPKHILLKLIKYARDL